MKTTSADTKYAEALAHDIADALNTAPHASGRVTTHYDDIADTWAVRITIRRQRYDLTMPSSGAIYGLFRNNQWLGGINLRTDAAPADVAAAMLTRISQTIR
ncbi:hypothetical protein [Micromonospora wenchangensis]|uniref:hypothetical protein n=1 Tax=Micromonospora wenchangensis TaxID=1185415 RepID=UPI0038175F72